MTKESNVSPCSWRLWSNLTAAIIGFLLASRCPLNSSATRSSRSLSLISCLFSPDPTWMVFQWEVRSISRPLSPTKLIRLHIFSFSVHLLSGPPKANWSVDKTFPSLYTGKVAQFIVGQLSFCHIFVLSFVQRRSKRHYFDTKLQINTQPPCWIYNSTCFITCSKVVSGIRISWQGPWRPTKALRCSKEMQK